MGALFRIDNVLRPGTRDNFEQILRCFDARDIKVLISATPRWHGALCEDARYLDVVSDALRAGHALALHGVEHRCRALAEHEHLLAHASREGEFDCKDYIRIHGDEIPISTQVDWLLEGRALLRDLLGAETQFLMPPAHAFGTNTLQAMKETGFVAIGQYGRWESAPYKRRDITHLPFDFEDYVRHTRSDGANRTAMVDLFAHHLRLISDKCGYYACFVHCDFPLGESVGEERLRTLRDILDLTADQGLGFAEPTLESYI